MERWIAFDLDGTLVDSREAVESCYRAAGAPMPEGAWGKPWTTWLRDPYTHQIKTELYRTMINLDAVPVLPAFDQMLKLINNGHPILIVTGASHDATHAFIRRWRLPGVVHASQCSLEDKVAWLTEFDVLAYVDDDLEAGEEIAGQVGCEFWPCKEGVVQCLA